MGRLRSAHEKDAGRLGGWAARAEDDTFLERHGAREQRSHAGERLLASFNRVARTAASAEGEPGEVAGFDGTVVIVRLPDGSEVPSGIRRVLKKLVKGVKNPLCVGDVVRLTREPEVMICAVEPRRNQLARADSHNRSLIHVFAANIDRLVIVTSAGDPEFRPGLVDRYLLIAAANGIDACLVVNKADRGDPEAAMAPYRALGLPCFATVCQGTVAGIAPLTELLRGQTCVVAGQSGVGKSSLLNVLHPGLNARTGLVADAGHGRHTTNSSRSYLLPDGGRLVDTPGVRECTITGLTPLDVAMMYPEIAALHPHCHFADCTHMHEPQCAVQDAVGAGRITGSRYDSYHAILTEDLAG